jgi:hypothetical protein
MPTKSTARRASPTRKPTARAGSGLGALERNILVAKGMSEAAIKKLTASGIRGRADFATVGDATTLTELCGVSVEVAGRVMAWALGGGGAAGGKVVVESGDVVHCVTCGKRQPKDYKSGDLCVFCGKQAEPVFSCYWCGASGPGKYCRSCGAVFVSPGELELAILLKRDGLPKEEIPQRLARLSPAEKEALWGRVRSRR